MASLSLLASLGVLFLWSVHQIKPILLVNKAKQTSMSYLIDDVFYSDVKVLPFFCVFVVDVIVIAVRNYSTEYQYLKC